MLEQDQWGAQALQEELTRLIKESQTGATRGELTKMLRELACMGYEPLIEAAEGLLQDEQDKKLGLHIEVESGLRRVCSKVRLERGVSSERYQRLEEEHLLDQLRELMLNLALDRPLKELSEVARLRESLWSGAVMSWLERVEAAGESGALSRERGLLLACSDQLGHVLEYDPHRFADEGINMLSELLQRMEHGGGEVSVVLPGESDDEGWEALRLSGLLSDLRGVKRLTIDGFGALKELALEGVQGLEEVEELDLKVLRADELLSLEGHPLLERVYAGVQYRAERGELTEALKAQLEGVSDALWFVARRCCDAVESWVKGVRVEYRYCPAGEFWMGSEGEELKFNEDEDEDDYFDYYYNSERPRHRVKISKAVLMGQTQITEALWHAMGDFFEGEERAANIMSWYDMAKFCNELSALDNFKPAYSFGSGDRPDVSLDFSANGYRMPTEAEWEYVAKAGTELVYAGSAQFEQVGWLRDSAATFEMPFEMGHVAQKKPNAWGLYDMSGNGGEWCSDQWDENAYKSRLEVSVDPCVYVSSSAGRSIRGGDEYLHDANRCRVASRNTTYDTTAHLISGRLLRWNIEQDQWSARALQGELARLIKEGQTSEARGTLAKMFRELACMGYEPLIEAAEGLLQDEQKKFGLHIEVESGLRRVCSKVRLERGVSGASYQPLEEEHLLHQLREFMLNLALDRPLKELSEVARLRGSLWSRAIMSWLERVEAAGESGALSRERGLLLACSDQLGHVLEYDPHRFADEGINMLSALLQRMEHGGGEVSVVLPGESDDEGWEALRLSGLLSDLRGVKRLTIDGFGALKELALEGVQGLDEVEELDLKVLRAEELLSLEGHPLLERVYAGVQHRAERGELTEALKAQLEGVSDALWFVARRCCDAVVSWVKGVRVEYRYCPAGEFWMGSEEGEGYADEHPRHRVKISKPSLMGQTQVTQALWEAVMGSNPSYFKGAQHPVEKITWYDMARFCNALSELENFRPVYSIKPYVSLDFSANGYRMPTEAEWEYAAKAGTELVYAGSAELEQVGWFGSKSGYGTHAVAQEKANAWGLHDMSGNVWEWCSDEGDYAYESRLEVSVDPCVYDSLRECSLAGWRLCRGGSWDDGADNCRVAYRSGSDADYRVDDLGGRLLRWNLDS